MALTLKQVAFLAAYLESHDSTSAAIAAGYSPKNANVAGCKLVKHPEIQAKIIQLRAKHLDKLEITPQVIVNRIAKIALSEFGHKTSDVLQACQLLGKHLKMFTDTLEIGPSNQSQVILTMPANGSEAPPLDAGYTREAIDTNHPDNALVVSDNAHYVKCESVNDNTVLGDDKITSNTVDIADGTIHEAHTPNDIKDLGPDTGVTDDCVIVTPCNDSGKTGPIEKTEQDSVQIIPEIRKKRKLSENFLKKRSLARKERTKIRGQKKDKIRRPESPNMKDIRGEGSKNILRDRLARRAELAAKREAAGLPKKRLPVTKKSEPVTSEPKGDWRDDADGDN